MVCFSHNKTKFQKGSGVMDTLLRPFTVDKYNLGERHARSLDPNHFLQGYNYVRPFSALSYREKKYMMISP